MSQKPVTGPVPHTFNPDTGRVAMIDPSGNRVEVELSTLAHRDAAGNTVYAIRAAKIALGWRYYDPDDTSAPTTATK